jgi:hypothetical protein
VDTDERYREAETGILTGQIDTCPGDCGAPLGGAVEGDGEPDPAAAGSDAADADAEASAEAEG